MVAILKLFFFFFFFFIVVSIHTVSGVSTDGEALLSLLNNFNAPPSIKSSWNSSDSTPCYWQGIQCDDKQNVISLNLSGFGISGQLGPSIGRLSYLKTIDLSINSFYAAIPSELGNCTNLEYLDFSLNSFAADIPLGIWKIRTLEIFIVHNNSLSGELPLEMTELRRLRNISLFNNQFSGVIPRTLGINSSLEHLDFTNNWFSGEIPPNLCFGKQLRFLDLSLNQLLGSIPSDVGSCPTLKRLILKHNNLSGLLPEFAKNPNLLFIYINVNNINGTIPSSLGNCTNLTSINLAMNKLTGPIPQELGNLVELQALNLSNNHLQGSLPPQISKCNKLFSLDLGFNLLNGSIPLSLRNLTQLSTLILRENQFTGGIPDFLSEFEKLSELQLGANLFGGNIPPSLGELQNLAYALNLRDNRLTGQIPYELGKLTMLQSLDISCNNLTGSLAPLALLHSLFEVNVSNNHFTGPIPGTLMKLLNLSPSSFLGNPGLCVPCQLGGDCERNSNFCPCDKRSSHQKGLSRIKIVMIALGSSLFCVLVLHVLGYIFLSCRRPEKEIELFKEKGSPELLKEVIEATENLDERFIIGRGAHGTVYKVYLGTDQLYAVKKLGFEGYKGTIESMVREIQTVGQIRHRNLVRLEDFWFRKGYGLILYKYMQNGSLHDVLHEISPAPVLTWDVRYRIALGTAEGLAYLHDDCNPAIVHQDIKPRNILLDSNMEPLISDFGIAKLMDQSFASIHSMSVVGTIGYIAPETAFAMTKTKESDVYSYGIILLELITRKWVLNPLFLEGMDLVRWVNSIWSSTKTINGILDSGLVEELKDSKVETEMITVLLVALRCTAKMRSHRPTMREVVKRLKDVKGRT